MQLEDRIVPTTIDVNPSNYQTLVPTAQPGDTVVFAPGNYASGLDLSGMNGTANAWIAFTGPTSGPAAVIQGTSGANTVELDNTSYLKFEHFTVDSQDLNDAIKAGGAVGNVSHDILIQGNTIENAENPSDPQQTVGISTKCIAWNWTIVGNIINDAGTGLYLGNSDGTDPFVNGIIENNLVENTIGYDMEIKDQIPYTAVAGMPTGPTHTIIRNNVFLKNDEPSPDGDRPNVFLGGFPASGTGSSDTYQVYGNLLDHNPRESLLQVTGQASIHDNIFVDDTGIAAIAVQPHSEIDPSGTTVTFDVKKVNIYNNTIYAVPTGIAVHANSDGNPEQVPVVGNLVFAATPISGITTNPGDNITDSTANAGLYVTKPSTTLGQMNFYPLAGQVQGAALDLSPFASEPDYNLDFNGTNKGTDTFRGAYAGSGTNPGWQLQDGIKPLPLTVTAVGLNKPYDGTTTAYVVLSDNHLGNDQITETYTSATYADPNVGNGKPVTVSGISISGASAGNYTLQNTTAATTANITAKGTTAYTYDSKGHILGAIYIYPNGNVFERLYDSDGSSTATLTNSSGTLLQTYNYNAQGQLTSIDYANGNVLTYTYTNGHLSSATLTNSGGATIQTYNYNAQGKVTSIDFANGNVLTYTYTNGVLSSATLTTSGGTLLDTYNYNAQDKVTSIVYASNGNVLTYTYSNGTLSSATLNASMANGGALLQSYNYNSQGQLTSIVYASTGNKLTYTYSNGVVSSTSLTNSSGTTLQTYNYTYNAQGQLSSIKGGSGTLLYSYTYDALGRVATVTYASNGNVLIYTYNSDGTSSATLKTSSGTTIETIAYDVFGRVTSIVYASGNTYTRTYNSDGTSTATLTDSSGQAIESYTYDAQGNLTGSEKAGAPAFPDTSHSIGIISDQLNDALSNPVIQFIATHMDGTQKLVASYNQEFRNYNPQWVLLYYKLATAAGPVQYIIDNQWSSDWSYVNAQESWFMHNASGQRLTNSTWDWDQLDPTNTTWQQYWLNQVSTNLQESGAQGVFADSFDAGIGSFWYDQSDVRFAGTNAANPSSWPNGYTWIQQLQNLAATMQAGLNKVAGAPLYIPNLDALVTSWDNMNYAQMPAAFLEGFGEWGPSYLSGAPSDWVLSMNRALSLTDQNKVVLLQPYLQNEANTSLGMLQRGFDLGTYLLLKSDHTYLNMVDNAGSSTGAYYYPEYTINLGPAKAAPATDVSQYLWNNVYRRDFQNGIVLVNPSDTTYTITLPQSYALVNFNGGGALTDSSLDSAGNYIGGDLSTTRVTTVTLASGQTATLMNPSLLPAAPTGLTATPASSGQINLKWNVVRGATAYWVERSTDDINWQVLAKTNGSTTTYADSGLQSGATYYYRVVAGNTIGNSSYSNVASGIPGPVSQFRAAGLETPKVGTGSSALTAGNPNAPQGTQVAFLQGQGTLSQVVNFIPGAYIISFEVAQRALNQAGQQTLEVEVDGRVLGTFTPGSTNYNSYTTSAFTVAAGLHTVRFIGLDPNGGTTTVFIDRTSIAPATAV